MTEFYLTFVPQYGLLIVFSTVLLACLGFPIPASIIVLTSAALAAAGDLSIIQVYFVTLVGFLIGDQLVFNMARFFGPPLLIRMRRVSRIESAMERGEALLEKYGLLAVLISRTLVSPAGPYVGYLSGAIQMGWLSFTLFAGVGALVWATAYSLVGYAFAGELPQISDLVFSSLLVGISSVCACGFAIWIFIAWKKFSS